MRVNIPEEPTDESIKPVFECLESCVRQQMKLRNHEEYLRLRGTPGEPIPTYDVDFFLAVRFKDDTTALAPVITHTIAERVNSGETLTFRVLKDRMTPDAPEGFCYYDPEFVPPDLKPRNFT